MGQQLGRWVEGFHLSADVSDPVLTAIVEEVFETIATLPNLAIVHSLVCVVAPMLAVDLAAPITDDTIHLPGEAIQLANSLIRGRAGPIEQKLVDTLTSAVIRFLRNTDDMDDIQVSCAN